MRAALSLALAALAAAAAQAPRCPADAGDACCRYNGYTGHEHYYTLHDNLDFWVVYDGRELVLKCKDGDGLSIDDACVPRFPRALPVARLTLAACAPASGGGSLAGALRRVGVQPRALRQLQLHAPRAAALSAALLDDTDQLAGLQMLALIAPPGCTDALPPGAAAALSQLSNLTSLHVTGIHLPANVSLPSSLRVLRLEEAGARLTARWLAQLPALAALALRDAGMRAAPPLAAAAALRSATIEAPLDGLPELLGVENITFRGASSLEWLGGCGTLARLRVAGGAGPPPPRWLARCAGLRALALVARALPALPPDLLDYTPALRTLDLKGNRLTFLEDGWLQRLPQLEELDLSSNLLTAGGVAGLQALPALRGLQLAGNPLGDLCADENQHLTVNAVSVLAGLPALARLGLAATGARRVCADWPRRLPLAHLDLSGNNITQLQEADVQWSARAGGAAAVLDARGNPLRALRLRRADYRQLPAEPQPVNVRVLMDSAVQCDCAAYWFVRALRERRLPAELHARCAPAAPADPAVTLHTIPLRDMTCPIEESGGCPAGCRCAWGAHENVTEAACARPALPDVRALPAAVRLRARQAGLVALPDHLPDNLVMLDVSGNNISRVSAAAAAALVARGRRVRLARNPLACTCRDAPLLRALHASRTQVEDYAEVTCEDGRWVGDAELLADMEACGARGGAVALAVAGALLALAAAAAAAAAVTLRRSALLRLKAWELARALCPAACLSPDTDDDQSEYDVFLSFAHGDRAAAERVVRELERPAGGGGALRVCLHSRDWRAGDWIPAQIAHSVEVSRCTVVLLSERFAQSQWARAELRLAAARALRDARPRLLVVLLDAAPPALDPELAHYVATHTYLSYSDPRFWAKLRRALAERAPLPRAALAVPATGEKKAPDICEKTVPQVSVKSS